MGQSILRMIELEQGCHLIGAIVRKGHMLEGQAVYPGENVTYSSDLSQVLQSGQVIIDFTRPDSMRDGLQLAIDANVAFVSGTTGLSDQDHAVLRKASRHIPVL